MKLQQWMVVGLVLGLWVWVLIEEREGGVGQRKEDFRDSMGGSWSR